MTARRLRGLRESVIREMTRLAVEHDALNLAQGIPDLALAPVLRDAVRGAVEGGRNQYAPSWGVPALREAISLDLVRRHGLAYDPDRHVTITCGVTEAVAATLLAVADPGDEVVVLEPFHETYLPAAAFAGARVVAVRLEAPDYRLDPGALRAAFGPRTVAVVLNNPHNPTGRVFTRDELAVLAALCREHDVLAVTDEIYDRIVYDGREHVPLATLPGMWERTVTIGGFGKTFSVTGWRLGYAAAPEPWTGALRTVHDFLTICAPTPLQEAVAEALAGVEETSRGLVGELTLRRDRTLEMLEAAGLAAVRPEGAFYTLVDFSPWGFPGDDRAFARWLTEVGRVAVVPGGAFYVDPAAAGPTIRIAFPKRLETLDLAAERLECVRARVPSLRA